MAFEYAFDGLAGCVVRRRTRSGLVGVYHAAQAGLDDTPDTRWYTTCEVHHCCVGHRTLRLALLHASDPEGWCGACGGEE